MEKTERRSRTHQTKAGMGREHDFVIDMRPRPCSLLDKEPSINDVRTEGELLSPKIAGLVVVDLVSCVFVSVGNPKILPTSFMHGRRGAAVGLAPLWIVVKICMYAAPCSAPTFGRQRLPSMVGVRQQMIMGFRRV